MKALALLLLLAGPAAAQSMKAVRVHEHGGPDKLRVEDVPRPVPGEGELLVRVRAAGVNPVDAWKRAGGMRGSLPMVPGHDIAGVVAAVGGKVTRFRPGDEVFAMLALDRGGGYAGYAIVREAEGARRPRGVSFDEAAGVPLTGLTAWQALIETAKLARGQTVLIHGGSGGVGSMAIQLARLRGARVLATASAKNLALVKQLGAHRAIDYRAERFEDVARDVDVVLDTVGGETLARSLACLKRGGIVVSLVDRADPRAVAERGIRAASILVRPDGAQLAELARLIERRRLRPAPTQVLPLADAARAHEQIETLHTRGKLVLRVD